MIEMPESDEELNVYDLRFLMKRGVSLSPPLWRTLNAVLELKKVTAEDLSRYTKRPRTIESRYLIELNKLGLAARKRVSRKVYYYEIETAIQEALQELGDLPPERIAHYLSLPADIVRIVLNKLKSSSKLEPSIRS